MPVADVIREALASQSFVRAMFEEGALLKKRYGAESVFDFSLGNPDVPPPQAFYRVLRGMAERAESGVHGYMPNAGFPEAREALAGKISAEQGVSIDGSHVVMACGAAGGLNVVFKSILNPGDEVVVSKPYFMEYRPYAANHGGRIVEAASLQDFGLDIAAIEEKLSPQTAAVLINSPHNPTGRVYSRQSIAALAEVMARHGRRCGRMPYLVCDEPYREIAFDGIEVPPILSAYSESIVVSSYSKSLSLPGERAGYIAVGPGIGGKQELTGALAYATRVLGFMNAPALMQRVVAALTSTTVDIDVYARRRAAFTGVLDEAGISYATPQGTFFLFCEVPCGGDDYEFAGHLGKRRILGVPGSLFAMPGWIRFAYCVDESVIEASRGAFVEAVADWRGGLRGR
ncbi:MAG: pyridoxal phosphate-dependent aminotransferase [Treponema sp.]|nr:pyridoxal phosphate-dependent aminotransferase [Treponema sp.]